MRLKTTLFLYLLSFSLSGQSQHYNHSTIWMRFVVTAPLSKNWDFFGDYIHRQQNNVGEKNPLAHESFEQLRFWANYKHNKWLFQVNPFSFIHSVPLLGKLSDYNAQPNIEYRFAASAELKQTVGKWTFKERGQYEYRVLKSLNYDGTARARARFFAQYALAKNTKFTFFEEYWFNVPPRKVPNRFDQNWTYLGVSQQITKVTSLELGYRRNLRERNSLTEFDDENALDVAVSLKF